MVHESSCPPLPHDGDAAVVADVNAAGAGAAAASGVTTCAAFCRAVANALAICDVCADVAAAAAGFVLQHSSLQPGAHWTVPVHVGGQMALGFAAAGCANAAS